ncbi:MAG: hypothetical protein AMXMBFR61_12050 [Fimbriimonadales bacterium]
MLLALLLMLTAGADDLRVPMQSSEPLAITDVVCPERAEANRMIEIRVLLKGSYTNPFHRAQIEVNAEISGPRETKWSVPAFYYQDFSRSVLAGKETLRREGVPEWRVRFRPTRPGRWSIKIGAVDLNSRTESKSYRIEVASSRVKGKIQPSKSSPAYLEYEDGEPFFGVGLNLGWPGARGLDDYEEWFEKLAENGGNLVRVWSFPGWAGLEWSDQQDGTWRRGTFYGLGKYSLDNAWLLDGLLAAADRHGIRVLLCLGTYGELKQDKGFWNEQLWQVNPYNAALGGPCKDPEEFFTDLKARSFYRRRLEYIVARYAAYPSLFGWELWNEVHAPDYWVHEMAQELIAQDPYKHPVTTSYGSEAVWKLGGIGLLTNHLYGDGTQTDLAERIEKLGRENSQFGKPHLLTELGIDFKKPDREFDPQRLAVNLRMGLWQAAASGFAAGALNWWWDNYVAAADLWNVYKPFAAAVRLVPWTKSPMRPVTFERTPAGVVCTGVVSDHGGFVWLRSQTYNWRDWKGEESLHAPTALELRGAKDGEWKAIWWDTHKGVELGSEQLVVRNGAMRLRTVPFSSSLALLLTRER